MFDLTTYLEEKRRFVDEALDRHLPPETERPSLLHKAMRYSVQCGESAFVLSSVWHLVRQQAERQARQSCLPWRWSICIPTA